MRLIYIFFFIGLILIGSQESSAQDFERKIQVCCIGDSHFEPRSPLLRFLARELGSDYSVIARGRRGWSSQRWRDIEDIWRAECINSRIILVSLGGNDPRDGLSPEQSLLNIEYLMGIFHPDSIVIRILRPNMVRPRLETGRDGIHLTTNGARRYARIIAEQVRASSY
jgi:lysophospholipase L1-like esterase